MQIKSNQSNPIKQFILLHDLYKFWYTLIKINSFTMENYVCGEIDDL